jgi:hypothetical protein
MVSRDAASWTAMTTLVEQNETNKKSYLKDQKKKLSLMIIAMKAMEIIMFQNIAHKNQIDDKIITNWETY